MKALAILRVSTTSQQIDEQRDELFSFIKSQGYDEIIPIEAVGASAIKMDEKYMELVKKVKDTILSDSSISAACVWELSRLGRNEIILMEFKEFFIKNHIQFICKNPYMKLLNEDGSVNSGMELAFSLFATMSKQEMIEKKERFRRTKKANAAKGMYTGGHTVKFGYKVKDGYFVEDENDSKIVKTIFDLYSTGMYSAYTLGKELDARGITLTTGQITNILSSESYTGSVVKGKYGVVYRQIISKELFEKCREIRESNKLVMRKGKRVVLGSKIVKCHECGATCTSNSIFYHCCRNSHHGPCSNGFSLRQEVADELLYRFAFGLHMMWLMNISEGKMEEYRKELEIVDEKLDAANKKIEASVQKKQRIIDTYLEGFIDKKTRDSRLLKVEDEVGIHRESINSLQDKRRAIMRLLDTDGVDSVENFVRASKAMTGEDKYEIVHKHIESLVAKPESYGIRDKRCTRPNAVRIIITSVYGTTSEYLYFPKYYQGHNLYLVDEGKVVPDTLEGAVYAMPED